MIDPGSDGTTEQRWSKEFERRNLPLLQLHHPKRVLLISPHPDDEVLAAGALLRQLVASGARVELAAVTAGEAAFEAPDPRLAARRISELHTALTRLGVADQVSVHHLRFRDGGVAAELDLLVGWLRDALAHVDVCVAPWTGDGHPDHEASGRAAELATAELATATRTTEELATAELATATRTTADLATATLATAERPQVQLVRYPVWLWHWADPERDLPWDRARALPVSPADRRAKQAAIQAFASQLGGDGAHQAILSRSVLAHFARPFEVFLV